MIKPEYLIPNAAKGRPRRRSPAVKHANIEIELEPELEHAEIVDRVAPMLSAVEDKYGLEGFWDAERRSYNFSGRGLTGEAQVDDRLIRIEIKTNAFMGAFAGRIKRELKQQLEEVLEL
jgi:hypothetical protein